MENIQDLSNSPFVHNSPFVYNKGIITYRHKGSAQTQSQSKDKTTLLQITAEEWQEVVPPLRTPPRKPTPQIVTVDQNSNNHDFSWVPVGA